MNDHTFASAIIGAAQKHARKPADYYPTPPDVTHALMLHLDLPRATTVWEPACGDGSMSKVISEYVDKVISTDLREDCGYGEGGIDFLKAIDEADWIITNPPFSHASQFIEKALGITPRVAMLLKSTYWHARSRYDLFHKHRPAAILPLTWRPSFLEKERGSSPLMDVIWVLWDGENSETDYCPLTRPRVKSNEQVLAELLA